MWGRIAFDERVIGRKETILKHLVLSVWWTEMEEERKRILLWIVDIHKI